MRDFDLMKKLLLEYKTIGRLNRKCSQLEEHNKKYLIDEGYAKGKPTTFQDGNLLVFIYEITPKGHQLVLNINQP